MSKKLLLTNENLGTQRFALLESNSASSTDKTTKVTIAKNAANTLFRILPGATNSTAGDFQVIGNAKNGWRNDLIISDNPILSDIPFLQQLAGANSASSTAYRRYGQRITINNKKISKVSFLLRRTGEPSFNITATIRRVLDDSILVESNPIHSSSISTTTEWITFSFFSQPIINEEVRVMVEIAGSGVTGNVISVVSNANDVVEGFYTTAGSNGVYIDDIRDIAFIFMEEGFVYPSISSTISAGTWAFNTKVEQDTSYAYTIRLSARISKSLSVDGSSATEIGVYESPTNISLTATIGSQYPHSWSVELPQIDLSENEYLFVEYRARVVTAASNSAARFSFICDEAEGAGEQSIITTAWTSAQPTEPPTDLLNSDLSIISSIEATTLSNTFTSTDSSTLSITETIILEVDVSTSDGLTLSIIESTEIQGQTEYINTFDEGSINLLESSILDMVASGVDPPVISIEESISIEASHTTGDSGTLSVTEIIIIDKELQVIDIISVSSTESVSVSSEIIAYDILDIFSQENVLERQLESVDTISISIIESSNVENFEDVVFINVIDILSFSVSEIILDREIACEDIITLSTTETITLSTNLASDDVVGIDIVDTSGLNLDENNVASSDILALNILETTQLIVVDESTDTTNILSEENTTSSINLLTSDVIYISMVENGLLDVDINTTDHINCFIDDEVNLTTNLSQQETFNINIIEHVDTIADNMCEDILALYIDESDSIEKILWSDVYSETIRFDFVIVPVLQIETTISMSESFELSINQSQNFNMSITTNELIETQLTSKVEYETEITPALQFNFRI